MGDWDTLSRTNIVIDDSLMEKALTEFVTRRVRKDLLELEGKIRFFDGYDYRSYRDDIDFDRMALHVPDLKILTTL